jgi:signal transduction histidine kinase
LKDLHVVVRNAIDWLIGSGLYLDRLRARDQRAQEDSPSPS